MAKKRSSQQQRRQKEILELFESAQRVIGLRLCFHDHTPEFRSGLPKPLRFQTHPACLALRRGDALADECCVEFDYIRSHRELAGLSGGRIQTCPHGMTEIAVPVYCAGSMVGVLFSGPCWHSPQPCPYEGVVSVPDKRWLRDRLAMTVALSERLGGLLEIPQEYRPPDRRQEIEQYIRDNLDGRATLEGLAAEIGLSPSRASHVVRQLLGCPFSIALQQQRMQQAGVLLVTSDLPISEISRLCGLDDPNYFSRVFRKYYQCSPVSYRRKNIMLERNIESWPKLNSR